jgi:regulator of cell morphogenesis and NO signaling
MTDSPFDTQASVNATINRFPESIAVFKSFGVDACCGGASSLTDAARKADIGIDDLMVALEEAIPRDETEAGLGNP